jgi:hypothetical protein
MALYARRLIVMFTEIHYINKLCMLFLCRFNRKIYRGKNMHNEICALISNFHHVFEIHGSVHRKTMEYEVQLDVTISFYFTVTSLTLYVFRGCVAHPQE